MPGIKAGFPAKRAADLLTRHGAREGSRYRSNPCVTIKTARINTLVSN